MNCNLIKMFDIGRLCIEVISPKSEVGHINFHIKDHVMEIRDLCIYQSIETGNYRGQGYGSILVKAVLEHAREIGLSKVYGITQVDDYRVYKFYRKHGFTFDEPEDGGIIRFWQIVNNIGMRDDK
ncbi:GNAT family N-acetyltransferase [Pseudoalteromonas piscicida]|uniref:GNAT family N-acetyltransferase n=1 Tax=Pseudoalteromonas piscicida TaxID=43662 RepID=UPI0027E44A3B|nr:GNAT family N-acetyltransferase [Pseudoalteromonas piscicida]